MLAKGVKNRAYPATDEPIWFAEIGAVAEGPDGNLYSTSPSGGKNSQGTVFKMTPAGALTVLFPFDRANGSGPRGGLTVGGDGYFYGTTYGGGKFGTGALFRIAAAGGVPKTLYHFRNGSVVGLKPPCADGRCPFSPTQRADAAGSYPISAPVRDRQGNFYGVTTYANNQQYGVLYRIAPPYDSASFKTLCIFNPNLVSDTAMARYVCAPKGTHASRVILGDGGTTLYGTTLGGHGTVFTSTLAGAVTTLHEFVATDGSKPYGVTQAGDGKLYGTTYGGGAASAGVVYRLDPSTKSFGVMSSFRIGSFLAGLNPMAGLVEGKDSAGQSDGYLYGATRYGGRGGRGILYRIARDADSLGLQVLHNFNMWETGRLAMTTPIQHSNGFFYGVTYQGGTYDKGVFYRLSAVNLPGWSLVRNCSPPETWRRMTRALC